MAWSVDFLPKAKRDLRDIDRLWQARILDYLEDEIAVLENPRTRGKDLRYEKKGLWRYRVGPYRIICEILDSDLVIVAVTIGHRKNVYG